MPTYEYACTDCGERLEVVQRFSDDPLTVCPVCSGPLRKVFSAVGVVFKGSGFYKTDSRSSGTSKTEPAKKSDGAETPAKTAAESTSSSSASADKPAATPATKSGPSDRVA